MDSLYKIKQLGETINEWVLPTKEDILKVEISLNIKYPDSYVKYLLEYSNICFGLFDNLRMTITEDFEWLYAVDVINEAWNVVEVPKYFIPFILDNGDYFCFDTRKSYNGEYPVKYWSHNGTTTEKWDNFLDWVENCWTKENS